MFFFPPFYSFCYNYKYNFRLGVSSHLDFIMDKIWIKDSNRFHVKISDFSTHFLILEIESQD